MVIEPQIEVLSDVPRGLDAIDVMSDGSWIGVGGSRSAREVWFGGHAVVSTALECHFPLLCALDRETAVLVDARTQAGRANAWVLRADGTQTAEFSVGDAVESLACVGGRLIVTHFDESFGNHLHGMLVFDRHGELQLHYGRDIAGACDIVDCYAVGQAGGNSVLLLIYPCFPVAEVDLGRRTQRVWPAPRAVHGAAAISAVGQTIFFHGSYTDRAAVHVWRRGAEEAVRVGSFEVPLRGLAAGWFLARIEGQVARVRFDVAATAADAPPRPTSDV